VYACEEDEEGFDVSEVPLVVGNRVLVEDTGDHCS
jgi:hypothetical protein